MPHTDDLRALTDRIRRLEDEAEIRRLIAAYGPLVDHGDGDATAALWTEDGRYDVDGGSFADPNAIADMVRSAPHQNLIRNGCAHFLGPVHVTVDGNEAVAVCYSLLLERRDEQHLVRRASANRWELRSTARGWRVVVRTNRVLDGNPDAHALIAGL